MTDALRDLLTTTSE